MSRVRLNDSTQQAVFSLAGGNPGAIAFLFELIQANPEGFVMDFITIDRMELYEDKLYMLWNDCCNRNIEKVLKIFEFYKIGKIKQQDIDNRIKNVGYGQSFDDLLEIDASIKLCPKCNRLLGSRPALSRRDNKTEICAECGIKEALEDMEKMTRLRKENNSGN